MSVEYFLDPKCLDLAKYFLPAGTEAEVKKLAAEIQQTIEDFLEFRKPEHTKP